VSAPTLRGLYAVTPAALCREPQRLASAAGAVLAGGARLLQYRDKEGDATARLANARALLALCRAHGAALIINDDLELAAAIGADGVHLGATDAAPRAARARLPGALIGVSCGNRLERARHAQDEGASYVAFGRFFASCTKPDAPSAELALLPAARRELRVPICAIGGLTPANAAAVIAAGADMVAAVEGVFGSPEPGAAARAFARLFVE
jgi:thiamine-phosphate pyrophosphorylase